MWSRTVAIRCRRPRTRGLPCARRRRHRPRRRRLGRPPAGRRELCSRSRRGTRTGTCCPRAVGPGTRRRPRRGSRRSATPPTSRCRCRRRAPSRDHRPCACSRRGRRPPSRPRTTPDRPSDGVPATTGRRNPAAAWGSAARAHPRSSSGYVAGTRCAGRHDPACARTGRRR